MEYPPYPPDLAGQLDEKLSRLPAGVNRDEFRAVMLAWTQVIYCRGYHLGFIAGVESLEADR